ncbi:hypothetical protein P691DRAFT_811358, partial [Macrolepiota fuliginosa MF-IS2]
TSNPGIARPASAQVGDASKAFTSTLITTTFVSSGVFTTTSTSKLPNGSTEVFTLTSSGTRTITTTTEVPTQIGTTSSSGGPPKGIIGGVIGATVIVILALVAFCIIRRKRLRQERITLTHTPEPFVPPEVRNISAVNVSRAIPPAADAVDARPPSSVSAETNNSTPPSGNVGPRKIARKKPAPYLDNPFNDPQSTEPSLSASIASSTGNSTLLSSQRNPSDDPYWRNILVDLASSDDNRTFPRDSTTASSGLNVETTSDPFSDPEDPFSDPKKNRISAHSDISGLSYTSLTPSQIERSVNKANLVARHLSVKSGLSYASLTPSQVNRRMDYTPSDFTSDTSSDRRLSMQSGTSIASVSSAGTAGGAESERIRGPTPNVQNVSFAA